MCEAVYVYGAHMFREQRSMLNKLNQLDSTALHIVFEAGFHRIPTKVNELGNKSLLSFYLLYLSPEVTVKHCEDIDSRGQTQSSCFRSKF